MQKETKILPVFQWASTILLIILLAILISPSIDININYLIAIYRQESLMKIMTAISFLGSNILIFLFSCIIAFLFIFKKRYKDANFYLLAVIGAAALEYLIKEIVRRQRPENLIEKGFSFPSGHASVSMALFGALALIIYPKSKKAAFSILLIPLLIGFSRIYLGVHWFSDIIAGYLFAIIWILFCYLIVYKILRNDAFS